MKWHDKELHFQTAGRWAYLNITSEIAACLAESGITEGLLLCNAMPIKASVFINDDGDGLLQDFEIWLEELAFRKWRRTAVGN